jgi:hypothetical protein
MRLEFGIDTGCCRAEIVSTIEGRSISTIASRLCDVVHNGTFMGSGDPAPFPVGNKRGDFFIEIVKLSHYLNIFDRLGDDSLAAKVENALLLVVATGNPTTAALQCRQYAFQLLMTTRVTSSWTEYCASRYPGFVPTSMAALYTNLLLTEDSSVDEDKLCTLLSPILVRLMCLQTGLLLNMISTGRSYSSGCCEREGSN